MERIKLKLQESEKKLLRMIIVSPIITFFMGMLFTSLVLELFSFYELPIFLIGLYVLYFMYRKMKEYIERVILFRESFCTHKINDEIQIYIENMIDNIKQLLTIIKTEGLEEAEINRIYTLIEEYVERYFTLSPDQDKRSICSLYLYHLFEFLLRINNDYSLLIQRVYKRYIKELEESRKMKEKFLKKWEVCQQNELKFFSELPIIHNIISSHHEEIIKTTEEESFNILESLNKIEEIANNILAILVKGNEKILSLWDEVTSDVTNWNEMLDLLRHQLSEQMKEFNKNIESIQVILKEVDSLGDLVEEVEDITDRTKLLSLNASIEAARAGEYGKTFAVVADEIRKLAEKSNKVTDHINKRITEVIEDVKEKFSRLYNIEELRRKEIIFNNLERDLTELLELNQKTEDIRKAMIQDVDTSSKELTRMVIDAIASIQFQDIIRQRLENINLIFQQINEFCNSYKSILENEALDKIEDIEFPRAEDIKKKYKMNKERQLHAKIMGEEGGEETGPDIELF